MTKFEWCTRPDLFKPEFCEPRWGYFVATVAQLTFLRGAVLVNCVMASLKSFIKAVRKAKTIADERAVVRKESAAIRTAFRDKNLDQTTRRINISKLVYLFILGEKTHFGQVECLKLLASPRFADKRLGYLATMLFLDENQEVLTLLTNSLDNDLQHSNFFIVGLALCCL